MGLPYHTRDLDGTCSTHRCENCEYSNISIGAEPCCGCRTAGHFLPVRCYWEEKDSLLKAVRQVLQSQS
jgi:hypothetical protein